MTGLFLTRNATPILSQFAAILGSQFAAILGWIINGIFNILDSVGVSNVGLTVVIFTIIIYTLMLPLTYKQQKFSRMSVRMNPELQAIQKKYKGKQDQTSMLKMQDEMKAVYAKAKAMGIPMIVESETLKPDGLKGQIGHNGVDVVGQSLVHRDKQLFARYHAPSDEM